MRSQINMFDHQNFYALIKRWLFLIAVRLRKCAFFNTTGPIVIISNRQTYNSFYHRRKYIAMIQL